MTDESIHDQMREAWGRVAEGWGTRTDAIDGGQASATEWMLRRSDPQAGQVVLDLAGGAGGLGRLAAERVGPSGRVLATDFAPQMVDVARRLASEQGLENLDFRTMDAQDMDLGDDTVDVVLCRSGIMLMVDPAAALREARRVLRPSGRLAFSVFTTPEENPWATAAVVPFIERGHVTPPAPGGPGMFALGDEERLHALATDAGFESVVVEAIEFDHHFADDDAVWHLATDVNALLAPLVRSLDDDERSVMRDAVVTAYAAWRTDDGTYDVPGRVLATMAH